MYEVVGAFLQKIYSIVRQSYDVIYINGGKYVQCVQCLLRFCLFLIIRHCSPLTQKYKIIVFFMSFNSQNQFTEYFKTMYFILYFLNRYGVTWLSQN